MLTLTDVPDQHSDSAVRINDYAVTAEDLTESNRKVRCNETFHLTITHRKLQIKLDHFMGSLQVYFCKFFNSIVNGPNIQKYKVVSHFFLFYDLWYHILET